MRPSSTGRILQPNRSQMGMSAIYRRVRRSAWRTGGPRLRSTGGCSGGASSQCTRRLAPRSYWLEAPRLLAGIARTNVWAVKQEIPLAISGQRASGQRPDRLLFSFTMTDAAGSSTYSPTPRSRRARPATSSICCETRRLTSRPACRIRRAPAPTSYASWDIFRQQPGPVGDRPGTARLDQHGQHHIPQRLRNSGPGSQLLPPSSARQLPIMLQPALIYIRDGPVSACLEITQFRRCRLASRASDYP